LSLVVIAGPTGTGKSVLAVRIAEHVGGEIVNFDSVQIYRGFDIGTAKPDAATRERVPHHLYDIVEATEEEFNAADFARLARNTCEDIVRRGKRPILVGGTYFYLRALLSGLPEMPSRSPHVRRRLKTIAERPRGPERLYKWLSKVDPKSGAKIAAADRHRVERALEIWITSGTPISAWPAPGHSPDEEMPALKIALGLDRATLTERLDQRVDDMYRQGLIEETRSLLWHFRPSARPFWSIGYREAAAVVTGDLPLDAAIAETKRRTRAYAKRQMTWLRSERNVHWIDAANAENAFSAAMRLIEKNT
jgi:tRNA dimethylallyltransferase